MKKRMLEAMVARANNSGSKSQRTNSDIATDSKLHAALIKDVQEHKNKLSELLNNYNNGKCNVVETIKELIKFGSINALKSVIHNAKLNDSTRDELLTIASEYKQEKIVEILLDLQVPPAEANDSPNDNVMKLAIDFDMIGIVKLLVAKGTNPNLIVEKHTSLSALFYAIENGKYEIASHLLSAGASTHYYSGNNEIIYAVDLLVNSNNDLLLNLVGQCELVDRIQFRANFVAQEHTDSTFIAELNRAPESSRTILSQRVAANLRKLYSINTKEAEKKLANFVKNLNAISESYNTDLSFLKNNSYYWINGQNEHFALLKEPNQNCSNKTAESIYSEKELDIELQELAGAEGTDSTI